MHSIYFDGSSSVLQYNLQFKSLEQQATESKVQSTRQGCHSKTGERIKLQPKNQHSIQHNNTP